MRSSEGSSTAAPRSRWLALASLGLLGVGALAHARADPARILTFIEVRGGASERAQALLREYARSLRRTAAPPEVAVLEEVDRSARFVLLESDADAEALVALERQARPAWQPLGALLTAPADRRAYRELSGGCEARRRRSGPAARRASRLEPHAASRPLYEVAHLDIAGPMRPGPLAVLARLAGAACARQGNLGFALWQQADRGNHFNLVALWRRSTDLEAFAASGAAREFRAAVAPWLGSPYDERLYRPLDLD